MAAQSVSLFGDQTSTSAPFGRHDRKKLAVVIADRRAADIGQEHDLAFQPLGGMGGHHPHIDVGRIHVALDRHVQRLDFGQKRGERRRAGAPMRQGQIEKFVERVAGLRPETSQKGPPAAARAEQARVKGEGRQGAAHLAQKIEFTRRLSEPSASSTPAWRREASRAASGRRRDQIVVVKAEHRRFQRRRQGQVVLRQQRARGRSRRGPSPRYASASSSRSAPATGTPFSLQRADHRLEKGVAAAHQNHDVAGPDRPASALRLNRLAGAGLKPARDGLGDAPRGGDRRDRLRPGNRAAVSSRAVPLLRPARSRPRFRRATAGCVSTPHARCAHVVGLRRQSAKMVRVAKTPCPPRRGRPAPSGRTASDRPGSNGFCPPRGATLEFVLLAREKRGRGALERKNRLLLVAHREKCPRAPALALAGEKIARKCGRESPIARRWCPAPRRPEYARCRRRAFAAPSAPKSASEAFRAARAIRSSKSSNLPLGFERLVTVENGVDDEAKAPLRSAVSGRPDLFAQGDQASLLRRELLNQVGARGREPVEKQGSLRGPSLAISDEKNLADIFANASSRRPARNAAIGSGEISAPLFGVGRRAARIRKAAKSGHRAGAMPSSSMPCTMCRASRPPPGPAPARKSAFASFGGAEKVRGAKRPHRTDRRRPGRRPRDSSPAPRRVPRSRSAAPRPPVGRGRSVAAARPLRRSRNPPRHWPRRARRAARVRRRRGWSGSSDRPASPRRGRKVFARNQAPSASRGRAAPVASMASPRPRHRATVHFDRVWNTRSAILAAAALVKVRHRYAPRRAARQQQADDPLRQHMGLAGSGVGGHPGRSARVRGQSLPRPRRLRELCAAPLMTRLRRPSPPEADHSRVRARWS